MLLKKKYYTIFLITSEDFRREFTVSKSIVWYGLLFGIGIIVLAVIGILDTMDQSELKDELIRLRKFEHSALNVIIDLGAEDLLMQQPDLETVLLKYFSDTPEKIPMNPPVAGYITQKIDPLGEDQHFGVDIAARAGDAIVAPADGLVVFSGSTSTLGNMIILAHDKDFYTLFGHNDSNLVSARETVIAGQQIATVGGLEEFGAPHLHFEIWKGDQLIDPINFIEEYKDKDVSVK